ncbi:unnamed protein product [Wuchereria bancrofti]|uniref:RRM domain-containing protein n=1 Tax=Wuchereria bancrofti TaxID=6293 RepID=A0A3P7F905_WUCBA|nr:unnamed protein product [Wuchereria bancrofti]
MVTVRFWLRFEDIKEVKDQLKKQSKLYMEDMNRRLEMELEDEREMERLRETITDSEREMTVICKAAQDQWFGVIEACKHSVYVNNVRLKFMIELFEFFIFRLNIRTSRKELEDHFGSCGTIITIEFCKDTVTYRFIGMNSARIEFTDIAAKLKAMDLADTFLKGSKIDVSSFFLSMKNNIGIKSAK